MSRVVKGIIIAAVVLVVMIAMVVAVLVGAGISGYRAAIRKGDEAAALQDMKTISVVEIQYFNDHDRSFGTFDQLIKEQLLNQRFSTPTVDGYVFTLTVTPRTKSQPASFALNADPQNDSTGKNHFYLDAGDSEIRVNPNRPARSTDPILGG